MPAQARVIVAEDDEPFRQLLANELNDAGYEVVAISDGGALLDYIAQARRGSPRHPMPKVIITDIGMPGPSGLDVLYGVAVASFPAAVVVITAFGSPELRERALDLGARAVFDKPFDIDELVETVRGLVPEESS